MINWWANKFSNDEIKKVVNSIQNKKISQGDVTRQFEEDICKFLNVKYAIAVSSGSIALLLALMAIDVEPDDEVIIPNRTWIATAHAVSLLKAKVVPVDVQADLPSINTDLIEKSITNKTKAIIAVHMNGRSSNMKKIKSIATKYKLFVIEDAAQALGSKNNKGFLGTQSDIGCFSLSVAKTVSSGQGGFLVTDNNKLAKKIRAMRTHGIENVKDPKRWQMLGFNFRYTDVLASIAIEQLKKINERVAYLKFIYKHYEKGLLNTDFKLIPVNINSGEVPQYIECLVPRRDKWIKLFNKHSIETRPFYPDINTAKYLNCSQLSFKSSKLFAKRGIYLPCGPDQKIQDINKCIKIIKDGLIT